MQRHVQGLDIKVLSQAGAAVGVSLALFGLCTLDCLGLGSLRA